MLNRAAFVFSIGAGTYLVPLGALAQAPEPDESAIEASHAEASAEVEYEAGLEAFEAKDYSKACGHFEKSHQLDPLPGVLFTLATCEARAGRVATSVARFREFLEMVKSLPEAKKDKQAARVEAAKNELESLAPEVPHIRIRTHTDEGAHHKLTLNGAPVGRKKENQRLPLDPGEYVLALEVDGAVVEERRVFLRLRDDVLIGLGRPSPRQDANPEPPPDQGDPDAPSRARMGWFYGTGVVAVAGAGVGGLFGVLALNGKGKIKESCLGAECIDGDAVDDANSAKGYANVSTVAFSVAAAAGVAATLFYVNPLPRTESGVSTRLSFGPQSVNIRGTF